MNLLDNGACVPMKIHLCCLKSVSPEYLFEVVERVYSVGEVIDPVSDAVLVVALCGYALVGPKRRAVDRRRMQASINELKHDQKQYDRTSRCDPRGFAGHASGYERRVME